MMAELGSLAQSARVGHLRSARITLFIVGGLTLLVNGFMFINASAEVDAEINKQIQAAGPGAMVNQAELAVIKKQAINQIQVIYGGAAALGLAFILLGIFIYVAPVPIVVTGLILYIAGNAIFALIDPANLGRGIVMKALVVILMAKAVQAAIAYQKETAAAKREAEQDLEVLGEAD